MRDIFELEQETDIPRDSSYIISYPAILSYFSERGNLTDVDVIRGSHLVYGWMPTVLDLYPEAPNLDLPAGAELLNRIRTTGEISDEELKQLVRLVNNSLVGTSKLLHFTNPDAFAIWDSKIYSFVFEQKPYNYRVADISNYRIYMRKLGEIRNRNGFEDFHASVNRKVGYEVSSLRAIELIIFLNAPNWNG